MVKLSVIVPVYNVEEYLDRCLSSLAEQTLKELEVIIVNDGTKDNSQEIIDKYTSKYQNMKAFIKENGGLSDARNFGIKKASGKYIAFLDSDDYVDVNMYEVMYEKAVSGNFDMVVCDLNYVYDDRTMRAYSKVDNDTTNIKRAMLDIYPAAWNKIFKKKLFDTELEFKKGVWFEDCEFLYRLLPYVKNIGVVKEPFYQYVQREGSITKRVDKRIYNYIDNFNGIVKFYEDNDLYDKYKLELEYVYVRYIYATFIKQACVFSKEEFDNAVREAVFNVKNHFPHYKRNKYFYKSSKGIYLLIFNRKIAEMIYSKYHKES